MANYSKYQTAPYQPGQTSSFKVSRSKIELFKQCPRCFWLDARLKIKRPSSPPFNINKTIDELYKKEFDRHREAGTPHPIMSDNQIKAVPYQHKDIDTWRYNFTGVASLHKPTNLHVYGAIDDVWVNEDGELIVVDYKATSKNREVSIDSGWQISYKRQIEVYQWLLRQNGFKVNDVAYFVYTNARLDVDSFEDTLKFKTKLISYKGNADWVEATLEGVKQCLEGEIPEVGISIMGGDCEFCGYAKARTMLSLEAIKAKQHAKAKTASKKSAKTNSSKTRSNMGYN